MIDDFLATLVGATVAGVVGLATLLIQQRLDSRRRLNEEYLAPAFSYVMGLPRECPWGSLADPEWSKLDSYHWLRIPAKYRLPLREMSARLEAYGQAYSHYFEFMGEKGWPSFAESVRSSLSKYLSADGTAITARGIGIDSGATLQVQWIVVGVAPYVLTNPGNPDRAWSELETVGPSPFYWAKQMTQSLRKADPSALQKLFESITGSLEAATGRLVAESLRESYGKVTEQAQIVRKLLARRLNLSGAVGG